MASLRDILALRRRAAEHAGNWTYDETGAMHNHEYRFIGRMHSPDLAKFICEIHNSWLLLTNTWLMYRKALKDRELIRDRK
jgi:uncharacterized metal-binding protein